MRAAWAGLVFLVSAGVAQGDALQRILQTGEINLGVRADAPPFAYVTGDGSYAGLAVRICEEVARRIGTDADQPVLPRYLPQKASTRFRALQTAETDLHCGPATATLSRREIVDFSILYFVDGAGLAGRPGAYTAFFEARAGRIGVLDGTTTVGVIEDLIDRNDLDASMVRFASHNAGLQALSDSQIDLYAGDQSILLFLIERMGLIDQIVVRDEVLSFEP